jgi:NhaP-type Na+/H+ or K+/H+ antiporter
MYVPGWEWAVLTIIPGGVGWLLGLGLGVSIQRSLLVNNPGVVSTGISNHIVFFVWGAATGLLVGLAQGFLFTRGLRFVSGSHFNVSRWKVGVLWTLASSVSWGVGLLLSELMLLATRRVSVPASPQDGAITPTGLALQIISMVALGIPISITTGVILARLLRHADTQVPPRYILIPTR